MKLFSNLLAFGGSGSYKRLVMGGENVKEQEMMLQKISGETTQNSAQERKW